jgi:hypothetical protein
VEYESKNESHKNPDGERKQDSLQRCKRELSSLSPSLHNSSMGAGQGAHFPPEVTMISLVTFHQDQAGRFRHPDPAF